MALWRPLPELGMGGFMAGGKGYLALGFLWRYLRMRSAKVIALPVGGLPRFLVTGVFLVTVFIVTLGAFSVTVGVFIDRFRNGPMDLTDQGEISTADGTGIQCAGLGVSRTRSGA